MKHLIISFKSRNSLYSFSKVLKLNGINHSTVNTPRSISTSCGLSLQIDYRYLTFVKSLISSSNSLNLVGVFVKSYNLGYERFEKIF